MPDPLEDRESLNALLMRVSEAAREYMARVDHLPAGGGAGRDEAASEFGGDLPENGNGSLQTINQLLTRGLEAATNSSGPRFFHFVTGGSTPAAVAADWWVSTIDNNAGLGVSSPLASKVEQVAIGWLRDLFQLPIGWSGVLTTGATMSNFTALGAARQWWGQEHGADIATRGMAGLPPVPVLTSGFVHASARKALSMLGIGHNTVRVVSGDAAGRLDLPALDRKLRALNGAPAIVIATAGEVNAGGVGPT